MEAYKDKSLSLEERAKALLGLLTTEEKIGLLSTHNMEIPRLGIKECFVGAEVARGFVSRDKDAPTTVFPEPIGLAGTFDTELMYEIGRIAADEARALKKKNPYISLMLWGPTVDPARNPLWGRNEECYGEDVTLIGDMSAAYTKGLANKSGEYYQSIPTLKHFCANNTEETRGNGSSDLTPRTAHEYYYAAFEPAIRYGGAYSIMTAYNELSGVPGMVNPDVQKLLKDKWGLGFAVTDGGDFTQNVLFHHYGTSHAETLKLGIENGVDCMTDSSEAVTAAAQKGLSEGILTEEDIDKAVYNTLLTRFRLGEFDEVHPYNEEYEIEAPRAKGVNHTAALEQTVLLKNNGLLPLSAEKYKKIAVIGINGNENIMDWYTGWSSYNISILGGLKEKYDNVLYDNGCDKVAIKSCLNGKYLGVTDDIGNVAAIFDTVTDRCIFTKSEYGHKETTYRSDFNGKCFTTETMKADSEGTYRWFSQEILKPEDNNGAVFYRTYFDGMLEITENGEIANGKPFGITEGKLFTEEIISNGTQRASELSEACDAAVICVGNDPMVVAREMYDRKTLALPEYQSRLAKAVLKANPNSVLTIVSGYPYSINEENELFPAILYTSHAGPELGTAFAKVLCGEYNPAGRLAQTWYKSELELPDIRKYDIIENEVTYMYYKGKPLYPFGYGLSYSSFEYKNMMVTDDGEHITVQLEIENTSDICGEEIPQVYFRKNNSRVKSPIKKLAAFTRVRIPTRESVHLCFDIDKRYFEYYDVITEQMQVESGSYTIMCGASCDDIRLSCDIDIKGADKPIRDLTKGIKAVNYDMKFSSDIKYCKPLQRHYIYEGCTVFGNCRIPDNVKTVTVTAAAFVGSGEIVLKADGKEISRVKVPPAVDVNNFKPYSAKIEALPKNREDFSLSMELPQFTAVLDIVFE